MNNKIIRILKHKNIEYILLTLIMVFGFGVRLYKIGNPVADWHSWRQADTASVSKTYLEQGINLLLPRYHDISSIQSKIFNPKGYRMVEFPFYNALNAVLANAMHFFSLEVWARLITITCALVTAVFLYLMGKRISGKWLGLLTAFFYLFIPYNIYFTRVILPDPMGVMFGVIAIWAFLEFTATDRKVLFYTSALFFAAAMLIKPYLGFYLFPIAYLAVKKFGAKSFVKDRHLILESLIFLGISFVPFLLWRTWEARFPEGIPLYKWVFNENHIRFKPSWWYWIFGERLGHLILGSLGLIPFIFGVLNTKSKNLLVQVFLAGALFYVVLVADANVMHDYYQILVIPAVALAVASGVVFLWENTFFNRLTSRIIIVVSVVVMLITGWKQVVGDYVINHPEIIAAGAEIDRIAPKNALVVAPYDGDTAFLYQTNRWGWPVIDSSIENIISEGASYYVSVDLGSADTKMIESKYKTIEKTDKFIIINLREPLK
jgi:hypothetical protein